MADNLFPVVYKPGIKKDGTLFQSEYCTNGFWVRFQNGMVKKIGGMKSTSFLFNLGNKKASTLLILPKTTSNDLFGYIGIGALRVYTTGNNFVGGNQTGAITADKGDNALWQIEKVVDKANNASFFAAFYANSFDNIFDDTQAYLYKVTPFATTQVDSIINGANTGVARKANGGICYAEPYLFIYGNNGFVQYSASNDPFNFNTTADPANGVNKSSSFTIPPGDKIIYAREIKGGTYTPSLLFWTLSAVVVVRNVGSDKVQFKAEKIAESSILSSRCVVENNGVFYWPGTDDFYVYNGVVQRMQNTLNLRDFFDNIDMNKRQLVFGVKNERKEIWWFYPEKVNAGNPDIGCTRVIIYNITENTWSDTPVKRDAAYFCRELGFMISYGKPLVGANQDKYLWRHELGTDQERWDSTLNNNNGAFERLAITSSFTTPTFSWAAFNPLKQATGSDVWTIIKRIEPDFKSLTGNYNMQLVINRKKYAQSPNDPSSTYTFTNATDKLDLNIQGRHISLTFSSAQDFEMGQVMMLLGMGDRQ